MLAAMEKNPSKAGKEGAPPVLAWVVVRRGEAAAKCTIRPLRGTPGLVFLRYPPPQPVSAADFPDALLLAPGAPALSAADAGRPLLLLDASWRHARSMARAYPGIETRSIPPGWRTAYPRHSKVTEDPAEGLATVEALHAALAITGHRDDSLLARYRWAEEFLRLNAALLLACPLGGRTGIKGA